MTCLDNFLMNKGEQNENTNQFYTWNTTFTCYILSWILCRKARWDSARDNTISELCVERCDRLVCRKRRFEMYILRRAKMNTESQNQIVLSHMTKYKTITSMDAFSLYGITRLSARIYDLRERGHKIGMVWEESVNRYGAPIRYGKYCIPTYY